MTHTLTRIFKRRHTGAFDLRGLSKEHRAIVQSALNVCDYPFIRVRRLTGARVPVTVADTSRFTQDAAASHDAGVHPLFDKSVPDVRAAALGLYWLPTRQYPAGRIEIGLNAIGNEALAKEVFIAEGAHAADIGSMTDAHRSQIFTVMHLGNSTAHGDHGWFEERGSQDYWAWAGEAFMDLFIRAFSPSLSRPLGSRQPWVHSVTEEMVPQVRAILNVK